MTEQTLESNFDSFMNHVESEYDEETINKATDLFEQILELVENNGTLGVIAGNMFFSLMLDGVDSVEASSTEQEGETDD